MFKPPLPYTAYQGRSQWYIQHWGPPVHLHKSLMEDCKTSLGVLVFPPRAAIGPTPARDYYIYATNGMSERRMPCRTEPHGDPTHRLELLAYAQSESEWIPQLLVEMAQYPFRFQSGFAIGHTVPVTPSRASLWHGYLLAPPLLEEAEFNPLPIDIGIAPDWVFHAHVFGLQLAELRTAIDTGGPAFAGQWLRAALSPRLFFLDIPRDTVMSERSDA